jgi:hypothetical protein
VGRGRSRYSSLETLVETASIFYPEPEPPKSNAHPEAEPPKSNAHPEPEPPKSNAHPEPEPPRSNVSPLHLRHFLLRESR